MPANRSIKDFFKPYTQVKKRRQSDELLDEIIVGEPPGSSSKRRVWPSSHVQERSIGPSMRDAPPSPCPEPSSAELNSTPSADAATLPPSSSLSSLPQVPLSQVSQTSHTSSKRVVKNGIAMVRNSDSEEDESDSSLEDLAAIIARRKPTLAAEDASPDPKASSASTTRSASKEDPRSTRRRELRKGATAQADRTPLSKPPETNYKFSLNSLVLLSNDAAAAEARVSEAKARLDNTIATAKGPMRDSRDDPESNNVKDNILASVIANEEEEGKRQKLLQAVRRRDALHQETVWHFFEGIEEQPSRTPFPVKCLPSHAWTNLLRTPSARQQAFLSGFIKAIALRHALPDELILWILEELCSQTRDDLSHAYLDTLETCQRQVATLLEVPQLEKLFGSLGAKEGAVKLTDEIIPSKQATNCSRLRSPRGLRLVVRLLGRLASSLAPQTRSCAISILLRLSFDDGVSADGALQITVGDAIEALINGVPDSDVDEALLQTSQSAFDSIKSPLLRHQLVAALPSSSPRAHLFRRRLALSFFLSSPRYLNADLTSPTLSARILRHLTSHPLFEITHRTDASILNAFIGLLDVAIDAGFSDFAFLTNGDKEEERLFNEDVTVIAREVRRIEQSIVDSGASHMRRTVAKEAARQVAYRLEYAVRTKGQRRTDIFAGMEGLQGGVGEFMEKWVTKNNQDEGQGDEV